MNEWDFAEFEYCSTGLMKKYGIPYIFQKKIYVTRLSLERQNGDGPQIWRSETDIGKEAGEKTLIATFPMSAYFSKSGQTKEYAKLEIVTILWRRSFKLLPLKKIYITRADIRKAMRSI